MISKPFVQMPCVYGSAF